MKKKTTDVAINFRHSAVGELLWMLPIIRSISLHNKKKIILFTRKETSAKLILDKEDYIEEIVYLPFRKGIFQVLDIINQSAYNVISIDGDSVSISKFKDKKILIVNVASKCGYTYQYEDLQKLYEEYSEDLVVLGFPSNDFLWQEPGENEQIKKFCSSKYGVTFPMFSKISVKKSDKQNSLYSWLSNKNLNGWNNEAPSWNFYKYLIDENGNLIKMFSSKIKPFDDDIVQYLNK